MIKGKYGKASNGLYWAMVYDASPDAGFNNIISACGGYDHEEDVFNFFKENCIDILNVEYDHGVV